MKPVVNCHTHLELTWMADMCPSPPGKPFVEWITGMMLRRAMERQAGTEHDLTVAGIEAGIAMLRAAGITHVGDISQTGLSIEPLLSSGLSGIVYVEVIGTVREQALRMLDRARELVDRYRPLERNGMRVGITPHAPYSTHPDALRAAAAYCQDNDVPLCIHVSESPAEVEALQEGTGPLAELSMRIDPRALQLVPYKSPVQYLADLGVLDARPLLVHMVQASTADLDLVARSGAKIAHCPRSNNLLQCGRLPLEEVLARDIPVALGTDSLASAPSLDVNDEAAFAQTFHGEYVPAVATRALLHNATVFQ